MTLYDRVLNADIDLSNSHATSVSAFLLFYMIDYALQTCQSSNKTARNTYLFIRLRNYSISIIHAFISGLSSTHSLIISWIHHNYILPGYFVHDIYHNICGGVGLRSLEIILHHITVLTCFYVVSWYRILVCYALFGLLMELNSIFLHARKLMILLNIDPESHTYCFWRILVTGLTNRLPISRDLCMGLFSESFVMILSFTYDDDTGIQCLTTLLPATPDIICTHREKSKDRFEKIGRVYLAITNISEFSDLIWLAIALDVEHSVTTRDLVRMHDRAPSAR
ncbi:unnamed protein product [Schistosoma margrebowiei]|uniref:Uncharacterized protein n=1 Tax=Schistosoma margrebowiei TaxID=48269 RepID=A0A183N3P9_9TREM|nr:unnamed protein product [Schistosoma margrebowiei]